MPKITIQVARQRYKRVPVIDPETGQPKKIQVNRKSGQPTYKTVMANDKDQPLPPRKCEKCSADLVVGQKYRSIGIKRQFGGIIRYRCMNCPSWQPWEYSDSLSARVQQIQNEPVDASDWCDESDASDRASELAEMIRELASEKEEAADNMEEGFGHETEQSSEIRENAQSLQDWADEVEQSAGGADFPEQDDTCQECEGTRDVEEDCTSECPDDCDGGHEQECGNCGGTGAVEEEQDQEALDNWREEVQQAIQDAMDNCPI